MNKIYKVVRDHSTGTYKAVSELGKSQGKGKGLGKKLLAVTVVTVMGMGGAQAYTLVVGGKNLLSYGWEGNRSIAAGYGNEATGDNSLALGSDNIASGNNSSAFGDSNTVSGTGSYAFGNDNTIATDNTFVMGNNVNATQANSVVLGNNSTDSAAVATAGANIRGTDYAFAGAAPAGVVSVGSVGGERQVQNVAAGQLSATSTDAVNGSQLFATNQALENLIAGGAEPLAVKYNTATKEKITLEGATGTTITNLKAGNINAASTDAINGSQVSTIAQNSKDVMGGNAVTNVDGTMTVSNIGGTGEDTIDGAVGVAYNTAKKAKTTVSQGDNIVVTSSLNADGSTDYNVATASDVDFNSVTAQKSSTGTVAIDSSIADAKGKTIINGVGDGEVKLGSNQAINGDQLYRASKSTADSLGGGSSVNADGSINQPTYSVQSNNYNNVGDAIAALDTADKLNVKYDSDAKDKVTLAGTTGTTISNVKAGDVSKTSTQAINGSQLYNSNQTIANTFGGGASIDNKGITAPTYTIASQEYHDVGSAFNAIDQRADQIEQNAYAYTNQKVSDLDDKLSAGIASTAALEQAPYVAGKWTYAAGAAYYNGQGAAGATIRRTADNGRWSFSSGVASGTSNGAEPLMRIAVSGVFN